MAEGQGDGGAIAVTWTKPKAADKAIQVASQARIFACSSALVLATDVFDSFIREFVREEWLEFNSNTRNIATKAVTRPAGQGGDYSIAERAEVICYELGISEPISIAILDLMVKWRNIVAHNSDRPARINTEKKNILSVNIWSSINKYIFLFCIYSDRPARINTEKKNILINTAPDIYTKYSHLDINLALRNFESRKLPVAKEVTSLMAVAVNFSRQLDEAAIKRIASDEQGLCDVVEYMLKNYFKMTPERDLSPWSEFSEAWQGDSGRRLKNLRKIFERIGITKNQNIITPVLPQAFLNDLVDLDKQSFAERFEISLQ